MLTRRASIDLKYKGINISSDIAKDLISFSYEDAASGESDNIDITLKDELKKWLGPWAPLEGDTITASIKTINWRHDGDSQNLNCGSFLVDEVSYAGRPITVNIGAIAIPVSTDFREKKKSKTWNKATIAKIASTIAKNAKLSLVFDASDFTIPFVEQSEIEDISFLHSLCIENGLVMKVYNNKLVIFSEAKYEAKPSIATLKESDLLPGWSGKTTLTNAGYGACLLEYTLPKNNKTYKYTFKVPNAKTSKVLKINESVSSIAEAERLTKSKLREENKKGTTLNVSLPLRLDLIASCNVNIKDLGRFDGKYYIDKAKHTVGGSTTALELHRVLEGY
ncbi:MAG: phage protein D [Clostridium sp.]|jgi:phage protein D